MRTIERTGQFKRDYKREAKGQHRATLDAELVQSLQPWPRIDRWSRGTAITR